MGSSRVTDYIIDYLKTNGITPEQMENETGIPAEKLRVGYQKALDGDEFLLLCHHLRLRPEKIASCIRSEKRE